MQIEQFKDYWRGIRSHSARLFRSLSHSLTKKFGYSDIEAARNSILGRDSQTFGKYLKFENELSQFKEKFHLVFPVEFIALDADEAVNAISLHLHTNKTRAVSDEQRRWLCAKIIPLADGARLSGLNMPTVLPAEDNLSAYSAWRYASDVWRCALNEIIQANGFTPRFRQLCADMRAVSGDWPGMGDFIDKAPAFENEEDSGRVEQSLANGKNSRVRRTAPPKARRQKWDDLKLIAGIGVARRQNPNASIEEIAESIGCNPSILYRRKNNPVIAGALSGDPKENTSINARPRRHSRGGLISSDRMRHKSAEEDNGE